MLVLSNRSGKIVEGPYRGLLMFSALSVIDCYKEITYMSSVLSAKEHDVTWGKA
jgi:hypothetical protein